jgi:hypothetical protein
MNLESILPLVQDLISEKVINTIQKEGPKVAAKTIYNILPAPARMFIKEETFVDFFINNKNQIINAKAKKSAKKVQTKKAPQKKAAAKKSARK